MHARLWGVVAAAVLLCAAVGCDAERLPEPEAADPSSFTSISAGGLHTCGVRTDGHSRLLGRRQ